MVGGTVRAEPQTGIYGVNTCLKGLGVYLGKEWDDLRRESQGNADQRKTDMATNYVTSNELKLRKEA